LLPPFDDVAIIKGEEEDKGGELVWSTVASCLSMQLEPGRIVCT